MKRIMMVFCFVFTSLLPLSADFKDDDAVVGTDVPGSDARKEFPLPICRRKNAFKIGTISLVLYKYSHFMKRVNAGQRASKPGKSPSVLPFVGATPASASRSATNDAPITYSAIRAQVSE
jgi:hypothetical protein